MKHSRVAHFWGPPWAEQARLSEALADVGCWVMPLPAGLEGLHGFLAQGGGLLLLGAQDEIQSREVGALLAQGRVVALEEHPGVDLPQTLTATDTCTHILIPRLGATACVRVALPLVRRLLDDQIPRCPIGPWGADAAGGLGPLLTFAAKFNVAEYPDERELFLGVADFLCQRLPFERSMLFSLEPGGRLLLRALCWPGGQPEGLTKILTEQPPMMDGHSPEYELFAMGRALPVSPEFSTFFPPAARDLLLGGEVALAPLYADQELLGVVAVDHVGRAGEVMGEGELALLETAAALIGTVINNYRLYRQLEDKAAELEQKLRELTVLGDLTRVLNGAAGPDQMAEAMLGIVASALDAAHGFIFLLDEDTGKLHMLGRHNLSDEMAAEWQVIDNVTPEGLERALKALGRDQSRLKEIVGRPLPSYYGPTALRAIHSRRKIVGLWGLGRASGGPAFTPADIQLLAIADEQLGVAVNSLRLSHMAATDGLTGLFTRRHFMDTLEHELRIARYLQYPLAMLLLDADHFKKVNDTHGHQAGDEVLRALARTIAETTRSSDTCARIGGEEFAVILPRCDQEQALRLAEKMRQRVAEMVVEHAGKAIRLTVSLGVAAFGPTERPTLDEVVRRADLAMYRSKADGRNRSTLWRDDLRLPVAARRQAEAKNRAVGPVDTGRDL